MPIYVHKSTQESPVRNYYIITTMYNLIFIELRRMFDKSTSSFYKWSTSYTHSSCLCEMLRKTELNYEIIHFKHFSSLLLPYT
jgi:hypothetical protein